MIEVDFNTWQKVCKARGRAAQFPSLNWVQSNHVIGDCGEHSVRVYRDGNNAIVARMTTFNCNDCPAKSIYVQKFEVDEAAVELTQDVFLPDRDFDEMVEALNNQWAEDNRDVIAYAHENKIDMEAACQQLGRQNAPDYYTEQRDRIEQENKELRLAQ